MGEATYYFKAEFKSEKEAKESLPKFKAYLKEHTKAYDEWQDTRGGKGSQANLVRLRERYPLAFKFVSVSRVDEQMNELAGHLLDFREGEINQQGNTIFIQAIVWHFDKWEHLVLFAHSLGAKAGYVSDEHHTPFDSFEVD